MPDMPADLKPRLQTWWSSLEGGTQAIFEAIYMEAPGAVSRAVSGGQWEADATEPGLAAQLGDGDGSAAFGDAIPSVNAAAPMDLPDHAAVGQEVRIAWTEQNFAKVDLGPYVTDVYVQDGDGATVGSVRLDTDGLAAGATKGQEWTFPGAASEGAHSVTIYMNAEGSDPGSGVPGPQGYRGMTGATLAVGADEQFMQQQESTSWSAAMSALSTVANAFSAADAVQKLDEGINWLVAAADELPPPDPDEPEDTGTLSSIGGDLAQLDTDRIDLEHPDIRDALAHLGGVAQQSMMASAEARVRVIEALRAVVDALRGRY